MPLFRLALFQVIGTEILDQEMIKDGQKLTPYFAAGYWQNQQGQSLRVLICNRLKLVNCNLGFGFMMFFVTATVLTSAVFYDAMDWGKALVAFGSILCPVLSITSTYGIISLFGVRTNSFMLVMPFLIMGIGVFNFMLP